MKTIRTLPEFAGYSELEVNAALDAYDDATEEEHSSCGAGEEPEIPDNPIVAEVFRLIKSYTERMNALIEAEKKAGREISENFLADLLSVEPVAPIERVAFDFVADAIMDEDDGEDE